MWVLILVHALIKSCTLVYCFIVYIYPYRGTFVGYFINCGGMYCYSTCMAIFTLQYMSNVEVIFYPLTSTFNMAYVYYRDKIATGSFDKTCKVQCSIFKY